ncbi:uncharacterized protein N7496_001069 [Penicillium cataractarum]|uniref:Copper transport protein n=1 Tax=Penicillium cataractarum TaxID=2100454 RepID=A0A9W9VV97_9EURO|nr:uncharacterized protein N7496_001069 [Penicillium cataractarum]KAJ5390001.1 hypothetical protein N7496_001069 [Penicillium cataractarum]
MDSMESMTMTAVSTALAAMNTSSMTMPNMPSNASNAAAMPTMPSMDGFLSSSWHIRSRGMFAGSCIGTICLVLCLEFLRRMGREYDAFILHRASLRQAYLPGSASVIPVKRSGKKRKASRGTDPNCPCDCPRDDDEITTIPGRESSNAKLAGSNGVTPVATEGVHSLDGGAADRKSSDVLAPYRPSPTEQVIRALFHTVQFAVAYFIMLLAMYYNGYIIICIFIGAFLGSLIFSWEPLSLSKENDATQVTKCCG